MLATEEPGRLGRDRPGPTSEPDRGSGGIRALRRHGRPALHLGRDGGWVERQLSSYGFDTVWVLLATSEMKDSPQAGTASRKPQPPQANAHA